MIVEPRVYKDEVGYLQLIRDILEEGVDTPDRTSVGQCRKLFNCTLWFDLRESQPIPTVRPVPARWAFEELWFFMSGETDTKLLEDIGITLWKGNTSRKFLDDRGLYSLKEGDMGKAYGHQWRSFGSSVRRKGVDQLQETIYLLKNDPYSRRIITTFWNPQQSEEMALLPCFYEHKFNVEKVDDGDGVNVLHLSVRSRSCDAGFGLPFNYTQYGIYLAAMAKLVDMEAGTLCIDMDDVHVYENQIEWCNELITRDYGWTLDPPDNIPMSTIRGEMLDVYRRIGYCYYSQEDLNSKVTLHINKELNTLEDLVLLQWEDLTIEGLKVNKTEFKTTKPVMAI